MAKPQRARHSPAVPPGVDLTRVTGTREGRRIKQTADGTAAWDHWGPYLSDRAWGTVREDYSPGGTAWELLPPRPRALARLPLERGRALRHLRSAPARLLRALPVEPAGPDPEGAALRPQQRRGQSRRGRQGVLLLPRQRADPLVHEGALQVPAGGLPLWRAARREPPPRPQPARVRAARHRRLRRGPLLGRARRVRQGLARGRADPDHGHQSRARRGAARPPAHRLVPESVVVGRGRGPASPRRGHAGRPARDRPRRSRREPEVSLLPAGRRAALHGK